MTKVYGVGILLFLFASPSHGSVGKPYTGRSVTVASPDGKVKAELTATHGDLKYRVTVDGRQVVAPSRLGIEADTVDYGTDVTFGPATSRKVYERYRFLGAHSEAINHANETTVAAKSHGNSYFVEVHVANDGVGVRLRLPAKTARKVQADHSTWKLEGDPTLWAAKLDNSYESD